MPNLPAGILHKKLSFSLRISSVNVTKIAVSCAVESVCSNYYPQQNNSPKTAKWTKKDKLSRKDFLKHFICNIFEKSYEISNTKKKRDREGLTFKNGTLLTTDMFTIHYVAFAFSS